MAINEKATVEVQVNGQQARQELNQLREYATNLSAALDQAYQAGDKKQIKALTKELKYVNSQMKTLQRTSVDIDKVMKNLSTTGPKELRQTLKAINAELSSGRVQRGSEEWAKYAQAARQVNDELKKIKEETEGARMSLTDQVSSFANKWWGFYTISSDLYNRINAFASGKVQAFAQMDEAMSQVTKYTGMERDEVKSLNEEFKQMDTRTAREQLNALAGDAGRLGIQSIDKVLEFVDAADKINVALGEDLGEDAVKNIGKLALMFGEDKVLGMRGAMLANASAVNELGQTCSAAEPFLVNFTARVAGAAHQAHISQADILGFAASMDENMLREETSATAYQNILMKMYTKTEAFANAAGIEVQKFSDLLRTDANEALLQFAEGLSKKGGLADLAPLFGDLKTEGAGVSAVLSVMAGKADEIRARQALANKAYQEGTSILKEFEVQNNTVQAGLDKAKKRANDLAVELGERLQPIMAEGLHLTSNATKIMIAGLDFTMKHKTALMAVVAAYVLYNGAIKLHNTYLVTSNAVTKLATTLRVLHAAATANLAGNLTGANKILTLFNANMIKSAAGQKAATAAVYLFSAAKAALTGNVKTATVAIRAMWATLNLNPFVAIATAVLAAGAAIYAFTSRTSEATKAQQKLIDLKFQAINGVQDEITEMQSLLKVAKDVNASYDARKGAIDKLNEILPDHLGNLSMETINSTKAQEAVDKHTQALIRQATIQAQLNRLAEINANMAKYGNDKAEYLRREINVFELLWGGVTEGTPIPQWDEWIEEKKLLETELKKLQTEDLALSTTTNSNSTTTSGGGTGGGTPVSEETKKALNAKLEAEELRHQNEMANLKRSYLKGNTMTRQEYAALAEDLELQHLNRQLEIAGLEPEKRAAIEQKILDARIKFQEECAKETERIEQEERERRQKQEEADLQRREEQQEKEKALALKYTDIARSVAENYASTMAEMIADGELNMKNFLKETLLMAVDALERIVEISCVEIMVKNLAATAPLSFIGAAKAALQIAAIKAGFAVVKGLIGNFYTGGYTGAGEWDEPKGVVHSNEFVANRFAVANPSVRPVLDLINQAQRNNTISTLSTADISRVLLGSNSGQTVVVQNDNPELMALIAECSQAVGSLQERLKYPIKAITTVSGRNGIRKSLDDYDTLLNNKSR